MPFIIYRPVQKLYRSRIGAHDWSPFINDSAIFATAKNAEKMITEMRNRWRGHVNSWQGHANHPIAITTYNAWSEAKVAQVEFQISATPTPSTAS